MHNVENYKPEVYPDIRNGMYTMLEFLNTFLDRNYRCIVKGCANRFDGNFDEYGAKDAVINHIRSHARIFKITTLEGRIR